MGHNKQSYGNGRLEAAGLAPPLPFGALQFVKYCNGRNEDPLLGICGDFIFRWANGRIPFPASAPL